MQLGLYTLEEVADTLRFHSIEDVDYVGVKMSDRNEQAARDRPRTEENRGPVRFDSVLSLSRNLECCWDALPNKCVAYEKLGLSCGSSTVLGNANGTDRFCSEDLYQIR
jgi:hypothetical protein